MFSASIITLAAVRQHAAAARAASGDDALDRLRTRLLGQDGRLRHGVALRVAEAMLAESAAVGWGA